ncbi:hypothetical protein ERO13_D11G110100v2 [Gossypium hirsutum]|uniref:Auxin-responsive protein n=2 Tax=Gossypium TaxID=3633 RepID=A0A7J8RV33_GOSDV|nr:hypothetical protein ERO13_D11G110100v2 [Gossypium hirsutum]MBA0617493.1 hypothetical protein [Gossypium davidsonii]MBA0652818.1 hypothetical protein [Gossypium klotzschianum]
MRRAISYCSSSIGSSNHFDSSSTATAASSSSQRDHNTDLSLGLSISTSPLYARKQRSPIKPLLRLELAEQDECNSATFYVKVYMEGIPIGRKVDLLDRRSYCDLIKTLEHMFNTNLIWAEAEVNGDHFEEYHVLTYEDKEGDWMMVGDVPWHTPQLKLFYLCMYCRMFLSVVRRLKISRSSAEL